MKFHLLTSLGTAALLAASATLAAADASPRVIKIRTGQDNAMKFDVTSLTVAPGETLKIVITNACTLPKTVMGHNWVLLKAGSDTTAFANGATGDAATGYIPAKFKDQVIASVGLLGPNESGEVTFQAPATPGDYPFLCSFPAHCIVGMKGVLTVKK
jgi:azurin